MILDLARDQDQILKRFNRTIYPAGCGESMILFSKVTDLDLSISCPTHIYYTNKESSGKNETS
jgi:hypothetical protein